MDLLQEQGGCKGPRFFLGIRVVISLGAWTFLIVLKVGWGDCYCYCK